MTIQRNQVQLIGNLGMNPEVKSTTTGKKVARFTLANVSYKGKGDEKSTGVNWFHLVAWEKQADIVEQYLYKGRRVGVSGRLVTRTWEDRDGKKHSLTEIVVNDIVMMDEPKAETQAA
ncbi:MAG TPA: single-stranded DNA-binding protein [Bacteroidia bacterium]|nr:single-stranded DNA-binding protein [Bacteroidia bacterium]